MALLPAPSIHAPAAEPPSSDTPGFNSLQTDKPARSLPCILPFVGDIRPPGDSSTIHPHRPPAKDGTQLMSKQILIVDDETNVRLSYRMTLETEGFTVVEADCAAEALERFPGKHFDLAILDMRMPEMDGLDFLAEMRKRGISTPTIIITAYGDIPHAVRAMKLGAIDFLKKPLTPDQLRRIVTEVIERHEKPVPEDPQEADPSVCAAELRDRYLKTAKRLLNRQDFDPARFILAKAMALDPQSAEAFNLAGVLFEMREDYDQALTFYRDAMKLAPGYEPAQQNMRRLIERSTSGSSKEPLNMGDD